MILNSGIGSVTIAGKKAWISIDYLRPRSIPHVETRIRDTVKPKRAKPFVKTQSILKREIRITSATFSKKSIP
jgi:hypothetical protein